MLASVLKTKTAVDASVKIVRAFVAMRHFIMNNAKIFVEIQDIKNHLIESDIHHKENDRKIEQLFSLMEQSDKEVNEGLFYNGQIFDSYNFISDLIRKAKKEIILIDNYIDDSVLKILNKREENVLATIYTSRISENLKLDIDKHNSQYSLINIQIFKKFHDRFLIIDNDVYHIGASFKDLGKSVFAFSKMGIGKEKILLIM